jgi:Na+/H+-translocating membrane pyrophosphatase
LLAEEIGSASLGALVLFAAYNEGLKFFIADPPTTPISRASTRTSR